VRPAVTTAEGAELNQTGLPPPSRPAPNNSVTRTVRRSRLLVKHVTVNVVGVYRSLTRENPFMKQTEGRYEPGREEPCRTTRPSLLAISDARYQDFVFVD